jgi:hypothetical protein
MTLENALNQVTTAIQKLTEVISNAAMPASAATQHQSIKRPTAKALKAQAAASTTPTNAEEQGASEEQDIYAVTAAALTALAREKGREAAVAVLADFSAKKLPEVNASALPAVLQAVQHARGKANE